MTKQIKKPRGKKAEQLVQPVKTVEETLYENFLSHHELHLLPKPTRLFKEGDVVSLNADDADNVIVKKVYHDGLFYLIEKDALPVRGKVPTVIVDGQEVVKRELSVHKWMSLTLASERKPEEESFFNGERFRINYSQMHLRSLFVYVYDFGLDFNPSYQRELVWTDKDKEDLIDSIFNHVDIGKFAVVELPFSESLKNGGYGYEILDGKQRLHTLCEFYEGKFAYKGVYYHQLSTRDKLFLLNYNVNVATFNELTEKEKLNYFLRMNHSGKVMDKAHLDKVRVRYEALCK